MERCGQLMADVAVGFQGFFCIWMLPLPDIYIFIANLIGSEGWGFRVSQDRIPDGPRHRRHYQYHETCR
jgi:hypothetical protein